MLGNLASKGAVDNLISCEESFPDISTENENMEMNIIQSEKYCYKNNLKIGYKAKYLNRERLRKVRLKRQNHLQSKINKVFLQSINISYDQTIKKKEKLF